MNRFSGFLKTTLLFTGILLLLAGCRKENIQPQPTPREKARDEFYNIMKDWYLWYDKMPDVNVRDYDSPEALLEALRYKPLDKWSFITSADQFTSYFKAGEYLGFGYGYTYDEQGGVWVTFVFKDSPLYTDGVRRGWKITAVDNHTLAPFDNISSLMGEDKTGVQKTFTFLKPDNSTASFTVTKDTIRINAVLACDTLHVNNRIVGHLVFQTFVQTANAELDSAFYFFQSVNINDIIIDLRYNGGGSMDVADKLASLIAGTGNAGKVFIKLLHNDKQKAHDMDIKFSNDSLELSLNRVFFITSRGSASASEAVINGLKPYIQVFLVGNNTYGKPVGMHTWIYEDYAFVPICFRITDANSKGDYYEGLLADDYAADGYQYAFNDRNEPRLHDVIYYLETGIFLHPVQTKSFIILPEYKGLRFEIGAL